MTTLHKKLIEVALPLAAVLNTSRATEVSVFVVRAFVRLRKIFTIHQALAQKLAKRESTIETRNSLSLKPRTSCLVPRSCFLDPAIMSRDQIVENKDFTPDTIFLQFLEAQKHLFQKA